MKKIGKKFGLSGHIEITKEEPRSSIAEITGLCGIFELKLYDSDGHLKEYRLIKNLTMNDGFDTVGELMGYGTQPAASAGGVGFNQCGVGTGQTIGPGQSTLLMELARIVGGYYGTSDTVWRNDATFAAGIATGAITESGLYNGSSMAGGGNTMLCGQTFAVINKGASDTLVVTWQYTLS